MIANMHSRMIRPHAVGTAMRQNVASRAGTGMSRRMAKVVALIISLSLFVVFVFSQVMHSHIASSVNELEKLEFFHKDTGSRNIELLAEKARLASQAFVEEQAREKFQLYVPKPGQVKRL